MLDKGVRNMTQATGVVEPGILVYLHVLNGLRVLSTETQRHPVNQSEPAVYLTFVVANSLVGREVKSRSLKNIPYLKRQEWDMDNERFGGEMEARRNRRKN